MDAQKEPAKGLSTRFEIEPRIAIPWGILVIVLGSTPILALFGVIRVRADSFHVPPWLVLLLSPCFSAGGAFLLLHGLAGLLHPASRLSRLLTWLGNFFVCLLAISFFGGMAVFLNWQLFAPGPATTRIVVMGFAISGWLAALMDRALLAFAVPLFDGFILVILWHAVRRRLLRDSAKRADGRP